MIQIKQIVDVELVDCPSKREIYIRLPFGKKAIGWTEQGVQHNAPKILTADFGSWSTFKTCH